jgi:hypothetical protein
MPLHALAVVQPDLCGPAAEIGRRLVQLCQPDVESVAEQVALAGKE